MSKKEREHKITQQFIINLSKGHKLYHLKNRLTMAVSLCLRENANEKKKFMKEYVKSSEYLDDIELILHMGEYIKNAHIPPCLYDRANAKAFQINSILNRSGYSNKKFNNYLDYGTFKGEIALAVGKTLNIPKSEIYGADVHKQRNLNKNLNFIKVVDDYKMNQDDLSIDLITCIMVLHHVKDINKVINELSRILKPGGILILREHDIEYKEIATIGFIVNILHLYYDYVFEPELKFNRSKKITIRQGTYHPFRIFIKILHKAGLKLIKLEISKNEYKNPFKAGWMVFEKI